MRPHKYDYAQLGAPEICAVLDAMHTDASPLSGSKDAGVLLRKALEGIKENLVDQVPERPAEALPPYAVQLLTHMRTLSSANLRSSAEGALLRDSLLRKRSHAEAAGEAGEAAEAGEA